jgi:hypothetical protein
VFDVELDGGVRELVNSVYREPFGAPTALDSDMATTGNVGPSRGSPNTWYSLSCFA